MLPGRDAAAEFNQADAGIGEVALRGVAGQIAVGYAQSRTDLQECAVLKELVGPARIRCGGCRDIFARIKPHHLSGLDLQILIGRFQRGFGCRRGDEHREHRRDLFALKLCIIVKVQREQLHDGSGKARHAAQLTGFHRIEHMDHICGRNPHRFACKAGIGQITGMSAQKVIGDAAADAVKLDALPDQPRAWQGAVHIKW